MKQKYYISASRRTDIPRFFHEEFFSAWRKGEVTYNGGYGRTYTVSLKPDDVMGYVFWSKDFEPFVKHPLFGELIAGNNAVFHFTLNDCACLEPGVAPLAKRIETLGMLCEKVGPQRVFWRFDPICKYRGDAGDPVSNAESFFSLLPVIRKYGIRHCFFSFMTFYAKLKGRGVEFAAFSIEERRGIGARMLDACSQAGINLYNCCNTEMPVLVPGIRKAHCVDEDLLRKTDRFGAHESLSPRPTREGCGCFESRDIGSYLEKCGHGCLYCYAKPAIFEKKY
jgi:hypothetical protein